MRARQRIVICATAFSFVFAGLAVRTAFVSFGGIVDPAFLASDSSAHALLPEIFDRNGSLLATNLPVQTLEIAGRDTWDVSETVAGLASVVPDLDTNDLANKLVAKRYVEVASEISPQQRRALFELGLPGVQFATRQQRFYPQADLAAHLIGHGEPGKGGVMGLERYLTANHRSEGVYLSIDMRVQQTLEDELGKALAKFKAKAAWGGVIKADTGEIIALASLPDFDPNAPGESPADARRNRATYDRYELGSAFKAITAAAALDAKIATENSEYDAHGAYRIADRTITDYRGKNRTLTFAEVIQHSSNIGIARIAADLGIDQQQSVLEALGFFDPIAMPLAENRSPQLPDQWGPVEIATISYGHGISVTPLHLLVGFNAVVNGGVYRAPTFFHNEQGEARRVFSQETSISMRRILRQVILDGTASFADVDGYYPIGKTATADKPFEGGYNRNTRIASFVGAVPGYAPEYTILVSLDEPVALKETFGFATAGWNAAPLFSRLVARIAPILGLMPQSEDIAISAFDGGVWAREASLSSRGETTR